MRVGFYLFTVQQPGAPTADPTTQTLIQVAAAANHRITILGADIALQGATPASTPIEFSWIVQGNGGTNSTAITAQKMDRGYDETILGTFLSFNGATATEPSASSILIEFALHRQGFMQWRPPRPLIVEGGAPERVGLRAHGIDATQGNNINTIITLYCEQ